MILSIFVTAALAADLPGEALFEQSSKPVPESSSELSRTLKNTKRPPAAGNLPKQYNVAFRKEPPRGELVLPPKGSLEVFKGLRVGDKIDAVINHWVIAFPDEKAPVVAELSDRRFKGIKLIGNSSLEKNSKRVFIEFSKVVVNGKSYEVKATGLSSLGQPGLIGEHHSRELEYFGGDFLSSFVAGYFDGLVPKTTNAFGQVQEDASVNSAMKKGMAAGAMSSATRFREKLKTVPEFSEIKGPIDISILILEAGVTKN